MKGDGNAAIRGEINLSSLFANVSTCAHWLRLHTPPPRHAQDLRMRRASKMDVMPFGRVSGACNQARLQR